jgi:hypothetical protein
LAQAQLKEFPLHFTYGEHFHLDLAGKNLGTLTANLKNMER